MDAKELIRMPDPREKVRIEISEVLRDVFGKPHIYIRARLTGWRFPHRALEPFLVIGDVVSQQVIIDRDELAANAYFDRPLPAAKRASFGYGKTIDVDFDLTIEPEQIARLDRARVPQETVDPFRR